MEEEILILKPSVINALVPVFAKNLLYAILLGSVAFGLFWLLITFGTVDYRIEQTIIWLIMFLIIFPTIPTFLNLILLHNTKYIFYKTHIVSEFELIKVKRHSTPYHQIVNVTSHVSIWDRFCRAGDLTMHTAEDNLPDLTLFYVRYPENIESKIYEMIRQNKVKSSE